MEVLLAAGVDVNTRTSAGTAMHEAALCGKMEVVRALLDRGVDLGIRDSRQNTVLDRSPGPVPAARHAGYHRGDKKYVPRNLLFPLRAFCVSRKPAV